MPLPMQAKLLRVLLEEVITRVGGGPTPARRCARARGDQREDLPTEIRASRFREDFSSVSTSSPGWLS